jgi:D-alanyl-D-alanine carboxypeptidase (penicillin-binding protein 5/6)
MQNKVFAANVNRATATLRSGSHPRTIRNRNLLVGRYRFVDGVKTGHTLGAHYVLVGAAHGPSARVVSVVLGEPSEGARDTDTLALLRWGVDQFHKLTVVRPGQVLARVKVAHHDKLRIALVARRHATFTVRRGQHLRLRVRVPEQLDGPLPAGRRVGSVDILYLGRRIRTLGLVTARAVPGTSTVARLTGALGPALTALALIIVVAGGALLGLKLRAVFSRGHRAVTPR